MFSVVTSHIQDLQATDATEDEFVSICQGPCQSDFIKLYTAFREISWLKLHKKNNLKKREDKDKDKALR